jgi:hypothetical protein
LNDVLQHDLVERQVGDEAFQLGVFVTQLLELPRLAGQHAAVRLLPAIKRLLGNPDLPAHVADGHSRRYLLQHRRDLLDRKSFLLHGTPSWPIGRIVPQNSLSH